MTLAEAIRKGSAQRAQCRCMLAQKDLLDDAHYEATCVLGAAYEGTFGYEALRAVLKGQTFAGDEWVDPGVALSDVYPELKTSATWKSTLEKPRVVGGTLASVIVTLNDSVGLTREQIADWVESLEARP